MNPEDPKTPDAAGESGETPGPNPEIDAFFQRLPSNLRWPPPTEAAIAAAVESIQRMSGAEADQPGSRSATTDYEKSGAVCAGCGQTLTTGTRFCGNCGSPVAESASRLKAEAGSPEHGPSPQARGGAGPGAAQHHYHHHFHHFVAAPANATVAAQQEGNNPRGRPSSTAAPGSRAELAVRQLVQDWAQACNTKHLDDLVELYSPDASLIRPNVLPVRTLPAIREFLFASLEAGLGDVQMESLRTEILGEIALDLGRCKMLVPVAMGKRREERGKYLMVMARQPAGNWKIIADCWSTDLVVSGAPPTEGRRPSDTVVKMPR